MARNTALREAAPHMLSRWPSRSTTRPLAILANMPAKGRMEATRPAVATSMPLNSTKKLGVNA